MKRAVILLTACVAASPAMACNSEMLSVLDWQVIENEGSRLLPYLLDAEVRYDGDRPFRMIHAGVMFSDVLGALVGQVNLARDQNVQPGDVIMADAYVDVDERLATLNRDDVQYRTCVWSIVYDDGTTEQFN